MALSLLPLLVVTLDIETYGSLIFTDLAQLRVLFPSAMVGCIWSSVSHAKNGSSLLKLVRFSLVCFTLFSKGLIHPVSGKFSKDVLDENESELLPE